MSRASASGPFAGAAGPALVVLAAGASTRLGEPKALAALGPGPDRTPLGRLLAAGAALGDPRPLVVTGCDHPAIAAAIVVTGPSAVELALNERWRSGRTGSVQLAAARRAGRDLCLAPVDVPLVTGAVFAALAREWERCGRPARGWLAPSVLRRGVKHFGHPVIVGRALLGALKEFPPARPLSELRALAEPLLALAVDDTAILDDLDTPADLARLQARVGGG